MTENKHTPLPYFTYHREPNKLHIVKFENDIKPIDAIDAQQKVIFPPIAVVYGRNIVEQGKFIVRACNSHYELLEALEELLNTLADLWLLDTGIGCAFCAEFEGHDDTCQYKYARQLLAKAKGEGE